jgi:endoglucanase
MKSTSSTGYNRDGYVKFDLSTINTVSSAKLRVFAQLDAAGSVSLGAYAVADSSWTETGITWNNRPPLGSLLNTVTVNGTTFAWYEIDVTSFVQAEKVAGRNSVTIGLHLPDVVNPAVKANSRNASGNKPELFITGS